MKYKWPMENNKSRSAQSALFTTRKDEEIESSEQSLSIGISTSVIYILTLSYIYITAVRKKYDFNTFSISFENCEKIGTTIFLIVFLALLQGLFASQGIYTKTDTKKAIIIAFNYIIILCWILFMFVFPKYGDRISMLHSFIAFFVIFCFVANCWLTYALYNEYFNKEDTNAMLYSNIIMSILAIVAGFFMATHYFLNTSIKFVAFFEFITLFSYVIFNTVFMMLPPIPDANLVCKIVS
jgi:hypothetical protein